MAHGNTPDRYVPGHERRAHVRHAVSLPLDIMIEELGQQRGEARDFCTGGLLVVLQGTDGLPADVMLSGKFCLITLHIGPDDYRLRARVAHAEKGMLGVAFINPDQIALAAIRAHAQINDTPGESQSAQARAEGVVSFAGRTDVDRILLQCNEVVIKKLSGLLEDFYQQINENFIEVSKTVQDARLQNDYFRALEELNRNRSEVMQRYAASITQQLNDIKVCLQGRDDASEEDMEDLSLSLIAEDEFNIWLAKSKVSHQIESDYAPLLSELEHRLGHLCGLAVDRKNNPYGPELFTEALQLSIAQLDISHEARSLCFDLFRTVLHDLVGDIYTGLNRILVDNDILPDFKKYLREQMKQKKPAQPRKESSPEKTEAEPEIKAEPESKGEAGLPETQISSTTGDAGTSGQNLYELVGEIRHLQQELKSLSGQGNQGGTNTGIPGAPANTVTGELIPAGANVPAYSTAELLSTISELAIPMHKISGDGKTIHAFRENLLAKIANSADGDNSKRLDTRQGYVIDITGNVFESLLNDLQVAKSVRPWLEKLAVPVMKMALLDENIFLDREHVVRKVINRLAELEVFAGAEDEAEQAAVRQAFNWVISLISNDFDGTISVYNRALQQLDLLLNVQQKSFEQNLKRVVAEAISEERAQSNAGENEARDTEQDDSLAGWLKQVHRLRENHWVLFDAYSDEPRRLKVAWTTRNKSKFVFVNVMGRKDRIVLDTELAGLFQSGDAVVLDGHEDPAMDRAQYTMLQNLHRQLLYQASHDGVTGLINRREFENCLQQAYAEAQHTNSKHAIAYIDLDKFKVINNNYGFEAGDALLLQVRDILQKKLDEENVLARIGVDQFGVLLQNTSIDAAVEMLEEMMDEMQDYRFEWKEDRVSVTFSGGIAIINASTSNAMEQFQAAESSCNIAKEMGGNSLQIYHAGSNRVSRRKDEMEWASKIDKTLDENTLFLRCQKIMPIQGGTDSKPHYEILLGIPDELGGNQRLGTFISAAEKYNKMHNIDRWVIKNAFEWLAANEDVVSDISNFTINLSGQSLNNDSIIDYIYQQMNKTGVPIERICFEITETTGISNLSDAADFIETIKGAGCKFALDDFGSGLSSYSYLKSLPIDYLKIDGMFIRELTKNQSDHAVVKSICEIGHFMDKKVIAEFVQDDAAIQVLRTIGVDYAQGYGIAKPHNLNDLLR